MRRALLPLALLPALALGACKDEAEPPADPLQVERGRALMAGCLACHNHRRRENGVGPHLVHLLGREAGTARGYSYSDAMRAAGLTWTPDTLRRFLEAPDTLVPGTNMVIQGLKPADADAIVQYLMSWE